MFEIAGRAVHSMVMESSGGLEGDSEVDERMFRSQGAPTSRPLENQQIGHALDRSDRAPKSRLGKDGIAKERLPSDVEMMKERFAKLLLGEDMSGGGKGVSSALALSNAITNLAASVFGEQWRLEPMSAERKARWRREIDWLLSVTDHIVEFVPSQQTTKDGTCLEIMVTRQRNDLHMNIPALRKLDAMLIEPVSWLICSDGNDESYCFLLFVTLQDYLDNFKGQNEFWYVSRDEDEGDKEQAQRKDDKWWLPRAKVPAKGLSDVSRKWLQFQKESVNQVLKAAMAINAQVLSEMEIPDNYIESLPKNGRASLGDAIYRSITVEYFDPEQFLSTIDLSTEHKILDLKNRVEASIVIWKRKMNQKDTKSSWGSAISLEKRELFEERAETILVILKQRFPGIPQSVLDISKIQYNKDVGQAVLESYSRILESLAFTVMSRIEDVLYADSQTRNPSSGEAKRRPTCSETVPAGPVKFPNAEEELKKLSSMGNNVSMTLSDFMGWHLDQGTETHAKDADGCEETRSFEHTKPLGKPPNIVTNKRFSYIEKLENLGGMRSPTARH
ncbi:hypothetical protein Taro_024352 [Colocasia esculenta]|uniref:PRONE domain-containing protein n=1 Tax=Colocasia esculenta TaxID=4460 RepID=A0A843VE74_COLES|nr:hypothetical protein [Colocasia esculenta]